MRKTSIQFVGREEELRRLTEFCGAPGSGLMHLRGRRRIGKSWLLLELQRCQGGLYFQGEQDSSTRKLQSSLAQLWDDHVGQQYLGLFRLRDLSWDRIFAAISDHARQQPKQVFVLMFDEIHWIAKKNSGFMSKLKKAWLSWEKLGNIKAIICGSSNRFFDDKTAQASSVLRGLRTHADVWVRPFSLGEVRRHFFPQWGHEEIALLYMMVGGVPYYLNQIPDIKNFIKAINTAFFTQSTIFIDELDEILNLDFSRASRARIRRLLASLGQEGKTVANICRATGISESSVRENIEKLVDYGLVFEKIQMGTAAKNNKSGTRYVMRDFYLNFYFQLIDKLRSEIKDNQRKNLFSNLLASKQGYHIPNFSGHAFELLIESVIDCRANSSMSESVFNKLGIHERGYRWGPYWEQGATQVDLIVESGADRESRVLEAKWIARKAGVAHGYLAEVQQKGYIPPRGYGLSFYLVLSQAPTQGLRKAAKRQDVQILELNDLF